MKIWKSSRTEQWLSIFEIKKIILIFLDSARFYLSLLDDIFELFLVWLIWDDFELIISETRRGIKLFSISRSIFDWQLSQACIFCFGEIKFIKKYKLAAVGHARRAERPLGVRSQRDTHILSLIKPQRYKHDAKKKGNFDQIFSDYLSKIKYFAP